MHTFVFKHSHVLVLHSRIHVGLPNPSTSTSTAASTANALLFPHKTPNVAVLGDRSRRRSRSQCRSLSSGSHSQILCRCQARATGIAAAVTSTAAAAASSRSRISPFLWTLARNPTFVSGLVAWTLAQGMKVLLNFWVERRWDLGMLLSSGGMPSSHSALCMSITSAVALRHGAGDALFPVCLGFSLIVMYDAIGVRRHAGMQAEVLNKIVEDLFEGHPMSQRKLKELLGHTLSQVIAGALLGILVAYVCCQTGIVAF